MSAAMSGNAGISIRGISKVFGNGADQVRATDNIDAAIRIFKPDIDLAEVKPKPLPPRHHAFKGEVARLIFEALRNAPGPRSRSAWCR